MRQASEQAATNELIANITEEAAEEKRKPRIDLDLSITRKPELTKGLAAARVGLKPAEASAIDAHLASVEHGYALIEKARTKVPIAIHPQLRYTPAAREAAAATFVLITDNRARFSKRLGNTATAKAIKTGIGVGKLFNADSPPDIREAAEKQYTTFTKKEHQAYFKKRGLRPDLAAAELQPSLAHLTKEIAAGAGDAPRQNTVNTELNAALLWLEIALERGISSLKDFKARAAAEAIEALVPMKAGTGRRATDREEEEERQDGEGEGRIGGGTEG